MLRTKLAIMAVVCALAAAACQTTEEALPTLVPTTAPPTETPTEAATQAAPTPTPTRVTTRPTLPPTFTPTPTPTDEATATPNFPSPTPFVGATADSVCNTFDVVIAQSTRTFNLGESPQASWLPVPGAQLYRVILSSATGQLINDQSYVAETTYTFPGTLFRSGETYGWEVYPINAANDQMCFAVGLELIPVTPVPIPGG